MSEELYTPELYIELARTVMGRIDLDPASDSFGNSIVRALIHYDGVEKDGLSRMWPGRVWLHPPKEPTESYKKSTVAPWVERLIDQYDRGITKEAIMLVPVSTSSNWFRPLFKYPICFSKKRIKFMLATGEYITGSIRDSAFVYLGDNVDRFATIFREVGHVVIDVHEF